VQSAPEREAALVRIVSWNVQHGVPDPVGPPALPRAVPGLRALTGDVYALQELDRGRARTRFAHQAADLAEALEGELVWARAKHWLWASQSNALVVRGEVLESDVVALRGSGERRVAAVATVVVAGRHWSVATTHLSLQPAIARRQLHETFAALGGRPKPWVLAGDLNLQPHQMTAVVDRAGYDLVEGPFTINARTGLNRRLDHVLLNGTTATASGVEKLPCSDHLAVFADLA
jgi:endonuclease/exonuclease/phosphatase family metal-dependent hydrolase